MAVREISDSEFKKLISVGNVLVDFYSPRCGPCKLLAPILAALSDEIEGIEFVKVDTWDNTESASSMSIRSVPTLILFKDGTELARRNGAASAPVIRDWINELVREAS